MSTNPTRPESAKNALTRPVDTLSRPTGEGEDEFISKKELAARLQVAIRTVERWQHDELLPYFKVGTVILFNWPEVVERLKTDFKHPPAPHPTCGHLLPSGCGEGERSGEGNKSPRRVE